jgi:hypothetical protein
MNVKSKAFRSFLNNIYPALGQARLEFLKNHGLALGYLCREKPKMFCAYPRSYLPI